MLLGGLEASLPRCPQALTTRHGSFTILSSKLQTCDLGPVNFTAMCRAVFQAASGARAARQKGPRSSRSQKLKKHRQGGSTSPSAELATHSGGSSRRVPALCSHVSYPFFSARFRLLGDGFQRTVHHRPARGSVAIGPSTDLLLPHSC